MNVAINEDRQPGAANDSLESETQEVEAYSYDECLELLGGFGHFQWFVTVTLILSFMTGGQIVYGITFLTTLPEYECRDFYEGYSVWKWDVCDRATICDSNMPSALWRINYDADTSYHNWVDPDKLDLTCVSKNAIGAIGSMFFVGFAISSGVVPRLGDKIGRKVPYLASMSAQFLMYILLFISTNIYLTIFCYFVIGLAAGGRVAIGTMYLNEFIPAKYQQVVITALNCGDGTTMAFQAIYYSINRDWFPVHIFGLIWCFSLLVAVSVIPESPKFFYANRRFREARQSLKVLAKYNKGGLTPEQVEELIFDTEASTLQKLEDNLKEPTSNISNTSTVDSAFLVSASMDSSANVENEPLVQPESIKLEGNLKEVWQIWQLRRNFLCLLCLLSASSFSYYLINFKLKNVKGSLTLNTLVSQTSEVAADVVSVLVYLALGPRRGFASGYLLATLGALLLLCFPDNIAMIPFFVTVAKFGVASSFNTVYLASVGLIPTMFASSVFGLCNVAARLVTIAAPVVAEQAYPAPMLLCLLAVILGTGISQLIVVDLPKFE